MLDKVNFDEARQSQLTFIEMLLSLGYKYISRAEAQKERKFDDGNFLLHNIASKKLMEINSYELDGKKFKFNEKDVDDAIDELEHIRYEGLIDTSQKIYNILTPTVGGKTIKVNWNGRSISKNLRFIDFENIENNVFHVTSEFSVSGRKEDIRPDIVCFVNGIPFAIIENKKSSVSVEEAIKQMNRNQSPEYCPKLYSFAQLLIASNGKNVKYGTTGTPNKFYTHWREKDTSSEKIDRDIDKLISKRIDRGIYNKISSDLGIKYHQQKTSRLVSEQDRYIYYLFRKKRFINLVKNHILFDAGIKKISRYQQYFAIDKMLERIGQKETTDNGITRRKGGLLWHTQGSGKSLTMVLFVKALIEKPEIKNPRIIIVTDRKDLDRQIRDTFKNCNLKKDVIQAKSGQHLINLIKSKSLAVITTLVYKFESARKKASKFIDKDQNIFVLVDEAHRSQSGVANFEMNKTIPNACYIGFTGTPLMTKDRESWKKFGGYIDRYTIDDALDDKIILPLIYEGRYVDLEVNKKQIDRQCERITENFTDRQKKDLQRIINTKIIKNNPKRIIEIAYDIENHFLSRFKDTGLKAQLVAPSKYSAILFQKYFESQGKIKTAVVISDELENGDQEDLHKNEVVEYLKGIKEKHISVEKYEKDVIESFKNHEDGIEIIIVVDKLLTGFDAPRNTVLYLTKDLHDHGLLQAIARVNRLFENQVLPKTSGFIIDYSENAKNIRTAMKLFGNYDEKDVEGTLIDVSQKINELEASFAKVEDVIKEASGSNDDEAYLKLLKDKPTRDEFYKSLNEFIRKLNECYVLQDFVHEFDKLDTYIKELKKLMELRKSASLLYADRINLADYKKSIIKIMDEYVNANEVELLTKEVNITDKKLFDETIDNLGSDKSKAEAIAHQVNKTISEKYEKDPEFYDNFSKRISEIIEDMRNKKIADIEALKQLKLLRDDVINKKDETLPKEINKHRGSDIFYRNLESLGKKINNNKKYIQTIVDITNIVREGAIIDWQKNSDAKRMILNKVDDYLYDVVKNKMGIEISNQETKEINNKVLELAEKNYNLFNE